MHAVNMVIAQLYSSKKPYGNKTSNIIALLLIFD